MPLGPAGHWFVEQLKFFAAKEVESAAAGTITTWQPVGSSQNGEVDRFSEATA
jgi:hypothetical protein